LVKSPLGADQEADVGSDPRVQGLRDDHQLVEYGRTFASVHRQKALDFGAHEFVDLETEALEDVSGVDLVFDVIGGDIQKRSASLIRSGGTLVTVVGPPEGGPADGLAVDFVVESDRAQETAEATAIPRGRLYDQASAGTTSSTKST
jgi:NADPH:quinone reductase-like Zn-dependent oxidoreductase